jgi:hypothetical protein
MQAANCYQAAWEALYQLEPDGGTWKDRYRQLDRAKDIRGPGKQLDDPVHMPNGRFEQSWIWMVGYSDDKDIMEEEFDQTMRSEWAKMRARRDRWEEEYRLVVEEMRRTIAYLEWKAMWWHGQAHRRTNVDSVTSQGLIAYAESQTQLSKLLAASCIENWVPALTMAGVVPDWANKWYSDTDKTSYGTLSEDDDEEGYLDDEGEDEEINSNLFDSYDLDD